MSIHYDNNTNLSVLTNLTLSHLTYTKQNYTIKFHLKLTNLG